MADSSRFARFIEKTTDRLDQIKQSLLKHEKNPNDREFLNDIFRAVHAIKNAALPVGLGRISELCFHLENFLQRIRQDRIEVNQEKIDILIACRDRLIKLIHDLKTTDKERATVKDLLKRIQQEMEPVPVTVAPEPTPVFEVSSPEPAPALEPLTPALETLPTEPAAETEDEEDISSLLPDEIRKQEYDRELFQIFIEQMQENLSLLRTLANDYATSPNQANTIALCSDLAGKLQTSANYMGYDRLADYYLQWVAELEMAGVELTMGTPVSLAFMDERISTVTDLFPQVKDTPASAAALKKAAGEIAPPQPAVREKPQAAGKQGENAAFKELFREMDEEASFGDSAEPIAALAGFEPQDEMHPGKPARGHESGARKKRITMPSVELDATFLEEERQSPEFDEELFQIFVQQLQENLSQLRTLVSDYPTAPNKTALVDQCSTLVGKLQASANYMGYDRLAEYYLQWIAELEMTGVDLSLGTPVDFGFMEEKIGKILELFPQIKDVAAPVTLVAEPVAPPAPPPPVAEKEPDESASFKELFIGMDEDEEDEDIFRDDSAPVAALTGYEQEEGWLEAGMAVDADLPEVDNFFGDPEEAPAAARKTTLSPAAPFDEEKLFGEEEAAPASEPVAALTGADEFAGEEPPAPAEEMSLPEVDEFFGAFGVELPDLTPKAAPPRTAKIAPSLDVENLFADEEGAEAPEPVAALSGADTNAEEIDAGPAEELALPEIEQFFGEFAEGEEVSFEIGEEPIAALSDEEFAEPPSARPTRRQPAEGLETLFLDEEEAGPSRSEQKTEDIEDLLAATAGGDDLDFEVEDESLAALGDSVAADVLFQDKGLAPQRRKIAEPAEDLADLFGEEEERSSHAAEEPEAEAEAVPPERRELYRKLSHAMKSMEEEVPTLEAAVDKSRARAAKPTPGVTEPVSGAAEKDQQLFARLFAALESTAEDDDQAAAKPIDQVIEEILSAAEIPAVPAEPVPEVMPVQITAPDVRQKFGLDAERMDSLMDQVGELVAGRSSLAQLYQEMSSLRHHLEERHVLDQNELTPLQNLLLRLEDTTSVLGRVSGRIREGVLRVRMIPAGQLFSLYQELARDLATRAKRQVELSILGEETEIDQFTVEDIGDCLLHLISNAIRHGIEPAEERVQLGKNEAGTVTLSAGHEGNHVVIEVADDGRGIDPKIIKATALAREILSGDELYRMSDHELARLIMTPGFTTDARMTPEAGMPGLDRVKTIMDRLGGTVQIRAKVGQGTRVRLLIPMKLPTLQALKVRAGTEVFALPLSGVEEIVWVTPENLIRSGDTELITFRHEDIQLHSLALIVGQEAPAEHSERFPVVVVNTDGGRAGMIVDEMLGLDEVAVKPLVEYLRAHRDFAGATIKGDNDFTFIPDVAGLMKTATEAAGI
ncbi:MAG: chemotaxis protein CheA [Desulfobulbaceae bacterium]